MDKIHDPMVLHATMYSTNGMHGLYYTKEPQAMKATTDTGWFAFWKKVEHPSPWNLYQGPFLTEEDADDWCAIYHGGDNGDNL
jgi:hypothetical protein